MGGRGSFSVSAGQAIGIAAAIVGTIGGAKVLAENKEEKGLPTQSKDGSDYMQVRNDGSFKMLREYGKDGYVAKEIGYHPEPSLTGNKHPVLHVHEYQQENLKNRQSRLMTQSEKDQYKEFLRGFKQGYLNNRKGK